MVNKAKVNCPQCGSPNTVSMGKYGTKKWGKQSRRRCKDCFTSFYENYKEMTDK